MPTVTGTKWEEISRFLVERAYRTIQHEPEYLFMRDGGPLTLDADLFHCRLIGHDDEIVKDWWRQDLLPDLRLPVWSRPSMVAPWDDLTVEAPRVATFRLQSNYAAARLSLEVCRDFPVPVDRPDFCASLAFLIYKREPIGKGRYSDV